MPCGPPEEASWLCELVQSTTGRPYLARAADVLIARPAAVLLIFVTAWVVGRLARRAIGRLVRRDSFPQRTVWLRHEEAVPERAVSRAARR